IIPVSAARGSQGVARMVVPENRVAELAGAMANSASRAAAMIQRNVDVVDSTLEKLDGWITEKTKNPRENVPSVVAEAQQIRDYVRALPDAKRMDFVHKRIEEGDLTVVTAVVHASPWIVGITPEQQSLLRGMAQERFAPKE